MVQAGSGLSQPAPRSTRSPPRSISLRRSPAGSGHAAAAAADDAAAAAAISAVDPRLNRRAGAEPRRPRTPRQANAPLRLMPDDRAHSAAVMRADRMERARLCVGSFVLCCSALSRQARPRRISARAARHATVGQPSYPHWGGFYFGGGIGFDDGNVNFSNAPQAPLAFTLRDTLIEADFRSVAVVAARQLDGPIDIARRLRRLRYPMAGHRSRRRSQLRASRRHRHRAGTPRGARSRQPADSSGDITDIRHQRQRQRHLASDRLSPRCARGPVGR